MSIFIEYDSTIDRLYDIKLRQYEIDIARLENNYLSESSFQDIEAELFYEGETLQPNISPTKEKTSDNKFLRFIKGIFDTIMRLLNDIISVFTDAFSSKNHVNVQDFIKSDTGEIEFENDLDAVDRQVRAEVRKGRGIIQAIAKGTKISDETVEKFYDNSVRGVKKFGAVFLTTAAGYALYQKKTGGLKQLKDELKNSWDVTQNSRGHDVKTVNMSKAWKGIWNWIKEGSNVYYLFKSKILAEARKQEKKANKLKKKR